MINVATLIACGVAPTQARIYADPLRIAAMRFEINTRAREAAFIAQLRVESANFTATEEGLYYTTPERIRAVYSRSVTTMAMAVTLTRNPKALANVVYAGKNGNGDAASGDGWKYRGRGLIQLTGRANYADAGIGLAHDYVNSPDLVATPPDACLTAAWFWHARKLNVLADGNVIDAITRGINGSGMEKADLRRQYTEDAFRALA